MLISKISFADTHANVHKENGEEVYEPKAETKKSAPMKQKEESAKKSEEKLNSHSQKNTAESEAKKQKDSHGDEKKDSHAIDSHGDEKKDSHAMDSHGDEKKDLHAIDTPKSNMKDEKEHKSTSLLDKFKNNKLVTLEEEDPYEVKKPMGIFWFAGVFLILLIVIFIFT
ncbi:hypothetical protein [Pigmentibacter ruber]|uniref:hypothetical protein n=1 Tax=Pigmentibacter ruber TaxID=2683196 RepID=UPI00131CB698|nr:hypothetical protein [Pigmentibacter ruber]